MKEYIWYQLQFLNVRREYEDCFGEKYEHLDEAISMLKKKRELYGNTHRIVECRLSERILTDKDIKL